MNFTDISFYSNCYCIYTLHILYCAVFSRSFPRTERLHQIIYSITSSVEIYIISLCYINVITTQCCLFPKCIFISTESYFLLVLTLLLICRLWLSFCALWKFTICSIYIQLKKRQKGGQVKLSENIIFYS